jgi:ParB/RepB/Spo0J family partition protein
VKDKPKAVELDTGRLEKIELQQLAVSPFNARKDAEVGPEDELVASIRAHGLLQPLVGHIATSGPAIVLICAGQRRLLALQHIAKPETKIPVRIVDEETAIEVSLAENLERKSMNPVDEFMAFKALIETGHYDADRIASRFGFSLNLVKRRLKMAALIPEILEVVREGQITIDAAEAYAAASAEVQRDVFKKHNAKGAWEPHKPERVRSDIVIHGLAANSRVGKFIGGLEAYRAAGGTVIDEAFLDLFNKDDDEGRMRDVSIVRGLVEKRQAELAADVQELVNKKYPFATGFEWANLFGTYNARHAQADEEERPGRGRATAGTATLLTRPSGRRRPRRSTTPRCWRSSLDGRRRARGLGRKIPAREGCLGPGKAEERQSQGYKEPTPEERAATERAGYDRLATNLYGRSLKVGLATRCVALRG